MAGYKWERPAFGVGVLTLAAVVVIAVLSPMVPLEKKDIALIVLGNVLSWPVIVLSYYFGNSAARNGPVPVSGIGGPGSPVLTETTEEHRD